jgi:hypothetical protein
MPYGPLTDKGVAGRVLLVTYFHAGFMIGLFSHLEDGGYMFFLELSWLSTDYTALYPTRQHSS